MSIPSECEIASDPDEAADSLTFALFDNVNPQFAPWARSRSEQLLFSHLYETLITVDCLGDVRPGLAETWKSRRDGRRWVFQLRKDARFWDGTEMTAKDVIDSWQQRSVEPMKLYAMIDSATVTDDYVLQVDFAQRHRKVPLTLSAPALAVAKLSTESRWPVGSGPYQISSSRNFQVISEGSVFARPMFGAKEPVIRFVENANYDARDLLEGMVDIIVTSDPAVIEYGSGREDLTTYPLPWNRTYVLLATSRVGALKNGLLPATLTPDIRDALASDVVRNDARGHETPSWWDDVAGCMRASRDGGVAPSAGATLRPGRVIYAASDPVARDLAERIVALAGDAEASSEAQIVAASVPGLASEAPIAEGVSELELSRSLWSGSDFAYVVSIPSRPPDGCYGMRALLDRAPWVTGPDVDLSDSLIPLVDTRQHVIAERDILSLIVDWYGNILVVNEALREN